MRVDRIVRNGDSTGGTTVGERKERINWNTQQRKLKNKHPPQWKMKWIIYKIRNKKYQIWTLKEQSGLLVLK